MTHERIIDSQLKLLEKSGYGLYSIEDLRALLPDLTYGAMKSLLHRLCKNGYLKRLAKNLFYKPSVNTQGQDLLFHIAARLRENQFNYLSLETVLSRNGMISQIPMQWISLMSSGRTYTFKIKDFGTIEFIHSKKKPAQVMDELHYDQKLGLWVASSKLALEDMKHCKRDLSLIEAHESV